MALFDNFPYSDTHTLNLDWLIRTVKNVVEKAVLSVNGQTGVVILSADNVGAIPNSSGTVKASNIADTAVTAGKIASGAVTRQKIANAAFDSEPTVGSDNLVTSGAVEEAIRNASTASIPDGSVTDAKLAPGVAPNRNLLVNWYFRNPVWQRPHAATSDSTPVIISSGYLFDRWIVDTGDARIFNGFIRLQAGSRIKQRVYGMPAGVPYVASTVIGSGVTSGNCSYSNGWFYIDGPTSGYNDVYGAKLEIGYRQTLYIDERFTEIPLFVDTLAECERFYLNITPDRVGCVFGAGDANTATNIRVNVPVPVTMISRPELVSGNLATTLSKIRLSGGSDLTPSAAAVYAMYTGGVNIDFTVSGASAGTTYAARVFNLTDYNLALECDERTIMQSTDASGSIYEYFNSTTAYS